MIINGKKVVNPVYQKFVDEFKDLTDFQVEEQIYEEGLIPEGAKHISHSWSPTRNPQDFKELCKKVPFPWYGQTDDEVRNRQSRIYALVNRCRELLATNLGKQNGKEEP